MGKVKKIQTVALNVRITDKQAKAMDSIIKKVDEYRSRSDFVRGAVDDLIEKMLQPSSPSSGAQA